MGKAVGIVPRPFLCARAGENARFDREICEVSGRLLRGLPIKFDRFTKNFYEVSNKNLRGLCIIFARFT